jgi:hypothetical protein
VHSKHSGMSVSAPGTGMGADALCPPDAPPPGSSSLASFACRAAEKVLVPAPVCRAASAGGAAVPLLLLLGGAGASAGLLTVLGRSDAAATLPASAWSQGRAGEVSSALHGWGMQWGPARLTCVKSLDGPRRPALYWSAALHQPGHMCAMGNAPSKRGSPQHPGPPCG